jgi:hypothetical protein
MWDNATSEVRDTYSREYFYRPYEAMKNAGTAGTSLTPDPVLNEQGLYQEYTILTADLSIIPVALSIKYRGLG